MAASASATSRSACAFYMAINSKMDIQSLEGQGTQVYIEIPGRGPRPNPPQIEYVSLVRCKTMVFRHCNRVRVRQC